jgi:CBS domain-containing protein
MTVEDVMRRDVVTVSPRAPLKDVARFSSSTASPGFPS